MPCLLLVDVHEKLALSLASLRKNNFIVVNVNGLLPKITHNKMVFILHFICTTVLLYQSAVLRFSSTEITNSIASARAMRPYVFNTLMVFKSFVHIR